MKHVLGLFAIGTVLVLSGSVASAENVPEPAWIAEDSFAFDALRGESALDLMDPAAVARQIQVFENRHKDAIATPAAKAKRKRSVDAFTDMGAGAATNLVTDVFADPLDVLITPPTQSLLSSESPPVFNAGSDTSVRIDPPGPEDSQLVVSNFPLRNDDGEIPSSAIGPAEDGFTPEVPLIDVDLPEQADGEVEFPDVSVSFNFADSTSSDGRLVNAASGPDRDMVLYPNTQTDTDTAVTYTLSGVETFHFLRSAESPERFVLEYNLPPGAKVQATKDGGAAIVNSNGRALLTVSPPYAVDAQGTSVPMSLSVDGDSIVLEVPHRGMDFAYPIMVDPVHTRDWWANGASPGYEGWTFHQDSTTNYDSSYTCPSSIAGTDPCGTGTGAGVYASAVPGRNYPANSKAYWRWTVPGGSSSSIVSANVNAWRYRKGGSNNGWAFYNLHPGTGVQFNDAGGGTTFSLPGANSGVKYLHVGLMTSTAFTMPSGATNWRYARLAHFSANITDNEAPSLALSGAPTNWLGPNTPFAITSTSQDPGLGLGYVQTNITGSWTSPFIGWCTGTYDLPCRRDNVNVTVSSNSSAQPDGLNLIGFKAIDIVGGDSHTANGSISLRVDKGGPTVTRSGPLTSSSQPGDQLTVRVDDTNLASPTYNSAGDLTTVPTIEQFPQLRSGAKDVRLYVSEQQVASESRTCASAFGSCRLGPVSITPDLSGFDDGIHTMKVVARDQAYNETTQSWEGRVDNSLPNAALAGQGNWAGSGNHEVNLFALDGGYGVSKIAVERGATQIASKVMNCSPRCPRVVETPVSIPASALQDGTNNLSAVAIGPSGERGVPMPFEVRADRTGAVIDTAEVSPWVGDSGQVSVEATNSRSGISLVEVRSQQGDQLAKVEFDCDPDCPGSISEELLIETEELPEGDYEAKVKVHAGAPGTVTTENLEFTVDHTAPDLASLSGDAAGLASTVSDRSNAASLAFTADDAPGPNRSGMAKVVVEEHQYDSWSDEVECGGASCGDSVSVPLGELDDAAHVIKVSAFDRAGNVASRDLEFVLDRSGPDQLLKLETPAFDNAVPGGDVKFSVSTEDIPLDGGGTVTSRSVKVDGDVISPEPCAQDCGTLDYEPGELAPGEHEVTLRAVDNRGNVEERVEHFIVDDAAPEISVSTDLEDGDIIGPGEVEIEVSGGQAGPDPQAEISTIELSVGGRAVTPAATACNDELDEEGTGNVPCPEGQEYVLGEDDLPFGYQEIRADVVDSVGNVATERLTVKRECAPVTRAEVVTPNPIDAGSAETLVENNHPDLVAPSDPVTVDGREFRPTLTAEGPAHSSADTIEPSQANEADAAELTVGRADQAICMTPLHLGEGAGEGTLVNGDSVLYPNVDRDLDMVIRPTVDGASNHVVIRSDDAPEEIEWALRTRQDVDLRENADGSVSVVGSGADLDIPENPGDIPAADGLAEDLAADGVIAPGTEDSDPASLDKIESKVEELLEERPGQQAVDAALPAGGPSDVGTPPGLDPTSQATAFKALTQGAEQAQTLKSSLRDEILDGATTDQQAADEAAKADADEQTEDALESIRDQEIDLARVKVDGAEDASGSPIEADLSVDGDDLELSVSHQSQSVEYPLAVSPTVSVNYVVVGYESYPVYKEEYYPIGRTVELRQVGWWKAAYCAWVDCEPTGEAGWYKLPGGLTAWLENGLGQAEPGPLYEAFWVPTLGVRTVLSHWAQRPILEEVPVEPGPEPGDHPNEEIRDEQYSALFDTDAELPDEEDFDEASVSARKNRVHIPKDWYAGMSFVGFQTDAFHYSNDNGVKAVHASKTEQGTDTAVIVPTWYVKKFNGSRVYRDGDKTVTNKGIRILAASARKPGAKMPVILKPHIDPYRISEGKDRTKMSFPNKPVFWTTYKRMIGEMASLAARIRARGLVVGTELSKVQHMNTQWRQVVAIATNRYLNSAFCKRKSSRCKLYYASNWDMMNGNPPEWWSMPQIDGIGADYYLGESWSSHEQWVSPSDMFKRFKSARNATLKNSNKKVLAGKHLFFTEAGAQNTSPLQDERYRTIFRDSIKLDKNIRSSGGGKWFKGIWWWNRFTRNPQKHNNGKGRFGYTYDNYTPTNATVRQMKYYQK